MVAVSTVTVAGQNVDARLLRSGLAAFAAQHPRVLRYYDGVADGPPAPARRVDVELVGRLHFLDRSATAEEAGLLIEAPIADALAAIPEAATLAEADPAVDGGLYDAAEAAHRLLLASAGRPSPTVVSAALALLRPGLFPILSAPIRMLYDERAQHAWRESSKSTRPHSRRTFWPVIRADLLQAQEHLESWRQELAASDVAAERWLARVSDVRLWTIAALSLSVQSGPR